MTDPLAPFVTAYQNTLTMSVVMLLIFAVTAAAIIAVVNRKRLLGALKNTEDASQHISEFEVKSPPKVGMNLSELEEGLEKLEAAATVAVTMPQSVTGLAARLLAKGVKKAIDEAEGTPGDSAAESRALPKVGEE